MADPEPFAKAALNAELDLAEAVRTALIRAALEGYEQAAMSGLCGEGAWEAAIAAMQRLDLKEALQRGTGPAG